MTLCMEQSLTKVFLVFRVDESVYSLVFESGVTRVGSVINWLRPYISKMFIRWEELTVIASGNKLQLISPSEYNSLFSASILAITFSNSLNKLGGELGGRYQVPTRNGVLRGILYFEDWTGLDWTSKTRTGKTRTSKTRTSKTRTHDRLLRTSFF